MLNFLCFLRGAVSAEASAQIPTKPNIPHVPKTPEQMHRLQQVPDFLKLTSLKYSVVF